MLTTKCGSLQARHTEEHVVQLTDTVFYQINCLVVHGSVHAESAARRTVFSSTLTTHPPTIASACGLGFLLQHNTLPPCPAEPVANARATAFFSQLCCLRKTRANVQSVSSILQWARFQGSGLFENRKTQP